MKYFPLSSRIYRIGIRDLTMSMIAMLEVLCVVVIVRGFRYFARSDDSTEGYFNASAPGKQEESVLIRIV